MLEKPVKSLGGWLNAVLGDKQHIMGLRQQVMYGIWRIEKSGLTGNLKL